MGQTRPGKRQRLLHVGVGLDLVAAPGTQPRAACIRLPSRRRYARGGAAPLSLVGATPARGALHRPRPRRPARADLPALWTCPRGGSASKRLRGRPTRRTPRRAPARRRRLGFGPRREASPARVKPDPLSRERVGGLSRSAERKFSSADTTA